VPASAHDGLAKGVAGTAFPDVARAVVAHFQASGVGADPGLMISWTRGGGSTAPEQLSSVVITQEELSKGVVAMLTNGGEPLAIGDYQVAVLGQGGRVYRVIAFEIRKTSKVAKKATGPPNPVKPAVEPVKLVTHAHAGLEFELPASYAKQTIDDPLVLGVSLYDDDVATAIYVVSQRTKSRAEAIVRARDTIATLQFAYQSIPHWTQYDLPPNVVGRPADGRMWVARFPQASLQFVTYNIEVDGTPILTGYMTVLLNDDSSFSGRAEDRDRGMGDFLQMVKSLRRAGVKPPPSERRKEAGSVT
jgi:hypothetical protein